MTAKIIANEHEYQPEVFPLGHIELDPPILVKALRTSGAVKKGNTYLLKHVWPNGTVMPFINAETGANTNPMKMTDFVRMVRVPVPANDK